MNGLNSRVQSFNKQLAEAKPLEDKTREMFEEAGFVVEMNNDYKYDLLVNGWMKIEVKLDKKQHQTGNFFIEFEQQLYSGNWEPSGIANSEADFYALWNVEGKCIFIKKETLAFLCNGATVKPAHSYDDNTNSTLGYIVSGKEIESVGFELQLLIDVLRRKSSI